MKIRAIKARRTAAASILIAGLAVTGCTAINYQATTHEYSASDGAMTDLAGVDLNQIMFVAEGEGSPARMIGAVNNGSGSDAEVEITVEGETLNLDVPAGETVSLEHDEELIVSSIGSAPGSMQEVEVSVSGEADSAQDSLQATVLDGTLERYRDLVPGGFDPSAVEHLEHGPDTWGSGAAHYDPEEPAH